MTIQPYPDDPHACLRAAERDIEHWIGILAGDGITDGDLATAAHYIRVAARARRLARERIGGDEQCIGALCKHRRSLFIGSERGPNERRAHAHLCKDCGTFIVSVNGERMTFQLCTDEQVAAAGVYAGVLGVGEGG